MKALVFNGPRDIRYESYDDPKLTIDTAVIVQVEKCSICGSDLHMYHGKTMGSRDYADGAPRFCAGHEFMGEVVETGKLSHVHKVGDRVFVGGGTGCGTCPACLLGKPMQCPKAIAFGIGPGLEGGQAQLVQVPCADHIAFPIPDGVTDEQAILLTDAMSTAYFGMSRADVEPGNSVAIVGLGPIGLLAVEIAFAMGASQVFAIDPVSARREHAGKLGAIALPPGDEAFDTVAAKTGGRKADSVLEASGAAGAVNSLMGLVKTGGTISMVGVPQHDLTFQVSRIVFKNLTVRAGLNDSLDNMQPIINLVQSGRVKGEGLFSHHMKLSEGSEAYRMFDARDDGVLKVMMEVD